MIFGVYRLVCVGVRVGVIEVVKLGVLVLCQILLKASSLVRLMGVE